MKCYFSLYLIRIFSVFLFVQGLSAQLTEPFVQEEIGSNWNTPVQIEFDDRGRGYVNERRGLIWILDEEGNRLPDPLVDISEEVALFGDHGMLAIALHPNFLTNGYIYLMYVVDRHHLQHYGTPEYNPETTIIEQATIGRITRYTADPSTDFTSVIPGSRLVLVGKTPGDGFPILMISHGIGSLVFGSDGTLLASCGDGGSFQSNDMGSAPETYYLQALEDGILRPKENIGSFRAQLVDCLNGKIIRIDPETGEGISSNPFYDPNNPNSARSKVWAMGFRQPYRFGRKPATGSHNPMDGDPGVLFVGDVGAGSWEELNIVTDAGMNFGWPVFEGFELHWPFSHATLENPDAPNPLYGEDCLQQYFKFTELVLQARMPAPGFYNSCDSTEIFPENIPHFVHALPALAWSNEKYNKPTRAEISHFDSAGLLAPIDIESVSSTVAGKNFEGSSSIPGFFYEGDHFPSRYKGAFFICDFSGWIRVFDINENYQIIGVDTFHTDVEFIVDLEQNPIEGSLYHVNLFHSIYRINYGGNVPPYAVINSDKMFGPSPLIVQFDASASGDANQDSLSFFWDFGDGTTSIEMSPEHSFDAGNSSPNTFQVMLTVTDSAGASASDQVIISPNNTPPSVSITNPVNGQYYSLTDVNYLTLKSNVTDAESDDDDLKYSWQWFLHHNNHFHPEFPVGDMEPVAGISPAGCNGEDYYYRIRLDVEDEQGLISADEVYIYPWCGSPITGNFKLEGQTMQNGILLSWDHETFGEEFTYEIERGLRFEPLSSIGIKESGQKSFLDPYPIKGSLSYRIKAVRADGLYDYSNVFTTDFPPPPAFSIQPNPVVKLLYIKMPRTSSQFLTLSVYEPAGKLIDTYQWWHTQTEENFNEEIDVSSWPNGMYFYIMKDGEMHYDGSILKAQ